MTEITLNPISLIGFQFIRHAIGEGNDQYG